MTLKLKKKSIPAYFKQKSQELCNNHDDEEVGIIGLITPESIP